jgi:hypothetical protein
MPWLRPPRRRLIQVIDSQVGEDNTGRDSYENKEQIRKIFHFDDNKITLIEPRIKAKSRLDFARRLSYLFLYANETENRPRVPRTELNTILGQSDVLAAHIRTWISTSR